jgi:hypothetical protein
VEENFNYHLEFINSHYCTKWHLEPIKLSDSSTFLEVARICPSILSTCGLKMQSNIFNYYEVQCCCCNGGSISYQSFDTTLVDIGSFLHLKAFIPKNFQTSKNCNDPSAMVSGRWTYIFHLFFHEIEVEKLPQWTSTHCCWDVFLDFLH